MLQLFHPQFVFIQCLIKPLTCRGVTRHIIGVMDAKPFQLKLSIQNNHYFLILPFTPDQRLSNRKDLWPAKVGF